MLAALAWPSRIRPSAWADRHRILQRHTSADPGRWRTSRVPYAAEWMDSVADPHTTSIAIVKSTQVGGSESLLNMLGYLIAEDPGPMLWVMPSREDAEQFCDVRVKPMVADMPVLRDQLGDDRSDQKMRMLRFRRCNLLFRTARVAGDLSQMAIRYLFGDEVDQWPASVGGEGSPWKVARERLRTYKTRAKSVMTSTPTVPEGLINQEFLAGDQRRFHLRCHRCDQWIVLEWQQVKWDPAIEAPELMRRTPAAAWYECQKCGVRWDDAQRLDALAGGRWVPKSWDPIDWFRRAGEDRTARRSYHLWAAYSPWLTWCALVGEYLEASQSDNADDMRVFENKWLARVWKNTARLVPDDWLAGCRRPYRMGEVPDGVHWITAGVDTQNHYLPYSIRGWGPDGRNWLLEHGRADTFAELEDVIFRRDWSGGNPARSHLGVQIVVIDSRWREGECVDFARRWGPDLVKLSKASTFKDQRTYTLSRLDRHPVTGQLLKTSLQQVGLNTNLVKGRLAAAIDRGNEGDQAGAFAIYDDVDDRYLHEMTCEEQVVEDGKHGKVLQWVRREGRRANHYWDTEVLNFAASIISRIDAVRETFARQAREAAAAPEARPQRPRDEERGSFGLWRPT